MLKEKLSNKKIPSSKKKRDLFFIIATTFLLFSMIFYYNQKKVSPNVPENLPKLYITCQHRISRSNYRDCVIDIEQDSTIGEIKIRGAFNSLFDKVGYRLRLTEQKSLLGMRKDDDWQLFAMYLDYPHMRVKLCLDIWRSLETTNPTAILPDSEYVNFYLNEEYIGLFLLTEKNDRKLFGLNRGENSIESSLIFQLKAFADLRTYDAEVWEQDLPIADDKTIMNYIMTDLVAFINNSTDTDFFNPITGIYAKFDIQNLIDFYVYNYFIYHDDFWKKNYFIMRDTYPNKFFLIPWDFDGSLGQWGETKYKANTNREDYIRNNNALFDRLLDDDYFRKACKSRWFELRKDLWDENYFMDLLFEIYEDIKDSIKLSMTIYDMEDKMDEYVNYLIQWIPDRIEFCDSYFAVLEFL